MTTAFKRAALAALALSLAASALGDDAPAPALVKPPAALVLDGVPGVPARLAEKLEPYGDFRASSMMSWHPVRRELLVRRRLNATNQAHVVTEPGVAPDPVTDFPDAVPYASYEPSKGEYFVFTRAEGGNEVFRLFREDLPSRAVTALSPEGERVSDVSWTRRGDRLVYVTQLVDRNNPDRKARTAVHVVDPLKPESDKVVARLEGGGWSDFRFSEDGRKLAFVEYISANDSRLWVMDADGGHRHRVTPLAKGTTVSYLLPRFARDGRGLFATSDRGSEFRRLVYLPLGGGEERVLTGRIAHDVDDIDVSFDAKRIAFTTNEDGADVLRFLDERSFKELPRPPLFAGVIGGLQWRPHAKEVAFHVTSARSAGDVFSYDIEKNQLTRWTNGNSPQLNTRDFPEPRTIRWKSFDGREISGLEYLPPERFKGRRPVVIQIHGGPEAEARPGFIGRNNYLVEQLGIVLIYPNVRGSAGFGKTFLKLDNGMKREDSVKDIGALLDWIKEQPDLDADRVAITGGSYGGYMTLACAVHYADRIAGAVEVVGISNFVTFLEHTESYRRDLRRVEYGDERDPKMRAFLESISPLNNASSITRPLMVVTGRNDPRVPWTEGEQIVANLKQRGTPVSWIVANDEGHGYAKKPNADYQFYATVEFLRQVLKIEP
jgi:dipeptidyl aminopeptidase/acylaminoacyl peptidase